LAVAICFIVPLYLFIGFLQKSIAGRSLAYAGIILVGSFFHFGLTESLFQRNIYINFYLVMLAFILSHLHLLALEQSGDDESIVKKTPVAPNNNNIGGFM
jgi:hypothetical protein